MKDQKALYDAHHGLHLKNDPDYSAALFQANPHHAPFLLAIFPTGEMFQPLSRFMLKASSNLNPSHHSDPSFAQRQSLCPASHAAWSSEAGTQGLRHCCAV